MEQHDSPGEFAGEDRSAFEFEGTWKEFAPIAFTNLLLTIVTLGIYRFWATTRERQYFWSRTQFIDERLEWSGTGKELFFGFLIVMVVIFIPFFVLGQVAQTLILRRHEVLGVLITLTSFIFFFYMIGVARYRALRYRLLRTRWRGIRGGGDSQGFKFGWSYMWKNTVGYLAAGLLIPWSMASLWNEKWSSMSFGPNNFYADAKQDTFFARFLLFYLAPIVLLIGGFAIAAVIGGLGYAAGGEQGGLAGGIIAVTAVLVFFYAGLGVIAVAFYAKYYREIVDATSWGEVQFSFKASTKDWIILLLGDVALVVLTLGIGSIFLSYRHWKFFVTHMEAYGDVTLDDLTQSTTSEANTGEGLLDAFDVGAI